MKIHFIYLIAVLIMSGCAALMTNGYGIEQQVDEFESTTTVRMTGGVVDADYIGMAPEARGQVFHCACA